MGHQRRTPRTDQIRRAQRGQRHGHRHGLPARESRALRRDGGCGGRPGGNRSALQEAVQVGGQFGCRRIPPVLIFLESLIDNGFEIGASEAGDLAKWTRIPFTNRARRLVQLPADLVGQTPGQELIKRFGRANLEEVFLAIARRGVEDGEDARRSP